MKSLFSSALIKEQLKRFWAIGALSFASYLLCILLPLWSIDNTCVIGTAMYMVLDILAMKNFVLIIATIIVPLITVVVIFSYMYHPNSTGVMHSMPFTKKQLFFSNTVSGYLLIVIPLIVFCLLFLLKPINCIDANGFATKEIVNSFPAVAGLFLRTLLAFTFYYCVFIFAATLVGNAVIYFLVSAALPFLAVGIYLLFGIISYYFVFGYYFYPSPVKNIGIYSNPILMSIAIAENGQGNIWTYYLVYMLVIAVLFVISYYLYHMSKQERAGDTIVFTPVKSICVFLLSLAGMILLGIFFLALSGQIIFMYAGFIIGFIISYYIAQMIAEKSFNVLYKYKSLAKYISVVVGIFVIIVIITTSDITGFSKYTPAISEIDGVYLSWPRNFNGNRFFITDPEIINETVTIHKKIINNRSELRNAFLKNLSSQYDEVLQGQHISYRLKNGRIITRSYILPESFYEESGMKTLRLTDSVVIANAAYWLNNPQNIKNISLSGNIRSENTTEQDSETVMQEEVDIYINDPLEIATLVEAIKKDYIITYKNDYDDTIANHIQIDGTTKEDRDNFFESLWYTENIVNWITEYGYYSNDPF